MDGAGTQQTTQQKWNEENEVVDDDSDIENDLQELLTEQPTESNKNKQEKCHTPQDRSVFFCFFCTYTINN